MRPKILVVEDEVHLLELLLINLEAEGYQCISAANGKTALEQQELHSPDMVLLDVMLPVMNGFEVATKMIANNPQLPIIFLTARADDKDKITGLKSGGVDYVLKPFNLEELLLRIRVHLKPGKKITAPLLRIGDFEVNTETFEILLDNEKVAEIGKKELQLLQLLMDNSGKVVSRELIMSKIWGNEVETTTRTIDNYILTLRKWFRDDPKSPKYFHSVRGVGYKLTP